MNSTILVGVAALILAGVFYNQADGLPSVAQRLPVLLIWIVAGLAVLMIIEEIRKQRRLKLEASLKSASEANLSMTSDGVAAEPEVLITPDDDDIPPEPINWKAAIPFTAALVAYVALIPTLGYIVTTIVFMTGVLLLGRTIRVSSAIFIAVGMTAFVWLVFIWTLGLPVPLFPWLT